MVTQALVFSLEELKVFFMVFGVMLEVFLWYSLSAPFGIFITA